MPPLPFIPARNSRHRIAVIALYRALARQARGINLPQDVCRHGKNPVPELVKRGFRRNKADVSQRLVFAALSAGYKFITLFRNAQVEGSKEHSEIVAYLREKNELIARSEANQRRRRKPRKPRSLRGLPPPPPVLKKVSKEGERPRYVSPRYPRPRDSFKGRRKIPHVVVTSSDHVFLRQKSPQPRAVTNLLRRKQARKMRMVDYMTGVREGGAQFAEAEDKWDRLVRKELERQGLAEPRDAAGVTTRSYQDSEYDSVRELTRKYNDDMADEKARAEALVEAVRKEEKLLAEEVEEAKKHGVRIIPTEYERIKPYLLKRQMRNIRRRKAFTKRKTERRRRWLVGLDPAPIPTWTKVHV
ncbi:DNA repair protein [Colletotrichum musicola]|uniref:DNA repair protein n=1 Tax=Colletotrichum musicola TaxID=2175873 RepID=A0A8H6N818_9PEZI|nr:DNA repair protein [Colletotrichum musicola]